MSQNLRALIAVVGVITVAAGSWVLYQTDRVSDAVLTDAGLSDSTQIRSACLVRLTSAGVEREKARGFTVDAGSPYAYIAVRGFLFDASQEVIVDAPPMVDTDAGQVPAWEWLGQCTEVSGATPAKEAEEQVAFPCACSSGSNCNVDHGDGGSIAAPTGQTLGPGYRYETWSGAGCVRKACIALSLSADDTWPAECPH